MQQVGSVARRDTPRRPAGGHRAATVDGVLLAGLGVVVTAAAVLRLVHLTAGIPDNIHPDEPTVVDRALAALDGNLVPPRFDWPPASAYLLAGAVAVARTVPGVALDDPTSVYTFGRLLFVAVSLTTVALTGLLAARMGRTASERRALAWGSATAMALSYLSVAFGSLSHPDHLQLTFMLGALLGALRILRRPTPAMVAAAGALAGLAGATKYVGVVAAVPVLAAMWWSGGSGGHRLRGTGALAGGVTVGFLAGTLGTVLNVPHFLDGFMGQLRHQTGGHVGFEADTPAIWFHVTSALPGNWGWPLTVLALGGAAAMLLRGSRTERLVAGFAVLLLAIVASSSVLFPRYTLLVVPFLAPCAFVALIRIRAAVPHLTPLVVLAVVVTLAVTLTDDLRLLRARGAADTRFAAAEVLDELDGPVWTERYALPLAAPGAVEPFDPARRYASFGEHPDVVSCDCVAVTTSYREERYRRRPDLYGEEIAVYDALREQGVELAVIAPSVDLPYRWTGLPQWGLRNVPLVGPVGRVGPTVTVLDLRQAR